MKISILILSVLLALVMTSSKSYAQCDECYTDYVQAHADEMLTSRNVSLAKKEAANAWKPEVVLLITPDRKAKTLGVYVDNVNICNPSYANLVNHLEVNKTAQVPCSENYTLLVTKTDRSTNSVLFTFAITEKGSDVALGRVDREFERVLARKTTDTASTWHSVDKR